MPLPHALIVAQPSARAPSLHVPFAAQALLQCMPQPLCPVGPLPVPKHARTHEHPSRPSHRGCIRFRSGPATHGVIRDYFWLYAYVLIETVPTVPFSSSPASYLAVVFRVRRSEAGAPARSHRHPYPDRGTSKPSCTPSRVPRAAQAPMHRMPHSLSPGGPNSPP